MPDTTGDYNRTMSKTVAVIGASSNRYKYGNKALRAFERQGYTVIPINPNEAEIEGHKAYATVLEVPGPIDMATVYVPPHKGVAIMDQLAAKGVPEVWSRNGASGIWGRPIRFGSGHHRRTPDPYPFAQGCHPSRNRTCARGSETTGAIPGARGAHQS